MPQERKIIPFDRKAIGVKPLESGLEAQGRLPIDPESVGFVRTRDEAEVLADGRDDHAGHVFRFYREASRSASKEQLKQALMQTARFTATLNQVCVVGINIDKVNSVRTNTVSLAHQGLGIWIKVTDPALLSKWRKDGPKQ